jgi:YHS domain-containing protein
MSSQVVDPVCGMQIDPAKSAGSFEYKGATYLYCSVTCLDKFKNDPGSFLDRAAPKPAAANGSAQIRKMITKGAKTAAAAARLFKIHSATVSRLLARTA